MHVAGIVAGNDGLIISENKIIKNAVSKADITSMKSVLMRGCNYPCCNPACNADTLNWQRDEYRNHVFSLPSLGPV